MHETVTFSNPDSAQEIIQIISENTGDFGVMNEISNQVRAQLKELLLEAFDSDHNKILGFKNFLLDGMPFGPDSLEQSTSGFRAELTLAKGSADNEANHIIDVYSETGRLGELSNGIQKVFDKEKSRQDIERQAQETTARMYTDIINIVEACVNLTSLKQHQLLSLIKEFDLTELMPGSPDETINPFDIARASLKLSLEGKGEQMAAAVDRFIKANQLNR